MKRAEPSDATVSTQLFRPILLALQTAGIDIEKFAAEVDLPLDALKDRDRRLPRELAVRTWLAASTVTNDDVFGLHVAEQAPVGMYGALELAIRSSPTVGQALGQLARYYSIVSNLSSVGIETDADVVRITHNATSASAVVDNLFVTIVRVGRELTKTPFLPRAVNLLRLAPRVRGDHERFFCAPVHFSSDENALVFDAATLDLPLVTADPELHAALLQRTETILNALPSSDRFLRTVRVALIKSLQSGTGTSLEVLARMLDMSVRTLQRRLSENATTQSELVDSVRHELALSYIADDVSSIEVAYLLGFSEAAAFHRAFKRWTGTTLREFRAQRREAK
jgi:AraC-like DNA-binding protein